MPSIPSTRDILDQLIQFDTVSKTPNRALIDYVTGLLDEANISYELVSENEGLNANLLARIGPETEGGVILSGHTDVVPTEGQNWRMPPFQLTEKEGLLFGRGTADMKGFVACAIHCALAASKRDLKEPIYLALSFDEEIGCVGVRSLIAHLKSAPISPRFCIIGEPSSLHIATGHKGKMALKATITGKEVHSALAPTGINALHLAADFIQALREIQKDLSLHGARDEDYDIPYSTIHAGVIQGGTALNIVPNHCSIDFEIRHLAADAPEQLLERIRNAAQSISDAYPEEAAIHIDILNQYPGLDTDPGEEIVAFMKSLTGANGTKKVAFGTEGGLFSAHLHIPTVICGPGSMDQGHKPDEFVAISQINECDAVLARLTDRLVRSAD